MFDMLQKNSKWIVLIIFLEGAFGLSNKDFRKEFSIDLDDESTLQHVADFIRRQSGRIASIHTCVNPNEEQLKTSPVTVQHVTAKSNQTENSTVTNASCKVSRFRFCEKKHFQYVKYRGKLPNMQSFSTCFWMAKLTEYSGSKQSIVSYCKISSLSCNTIVIWVKDGIIEVEMSSNSHQFKHPVTAKTSYWHRTHLCVVKSATAVSAYINGSINGTVNIKNGSIPGDGVLILGQNLDTIENKDSIEINQAEQGFRGEIDGFQLWKRALNRTEIEFLHRAGCSCSRDSIVTFTESDSFVTGNLSANWNISCLAL